MEANNFQHADAARRSPTDEILAQIVAVKEPYKGQKLKLRIAGKGPDIFNVVFGLMVAMWFILPAYWFLTQKVKTPFQTDGTTDLGDPFNNRNLRDPFGNNPWGRK